MNTHTELHFNKQMYKYKSKQRLMPQSALATQQTKGETSPSCKEHSVQHRDPKKEGGIRESHGSVGAAEWINNGTAERKENACRERRLLCGDQKSFLEAGLQEI